jgi:hypothetical protein
MKVRRLWIAAITSGVLLAAPAGSRAQSCTGCPKPSFGPAIVVPSAFPYYVSVGDAPAIADFDLDGNLDLAVGASDGMAHVFPGTSSGVFSSPTGYPTNSGSSSTAVADFNRDGIPDLVAAGYYSNSFSLLLGLPGGALGSPSVVSTEIVPARVATGDFNGDRFPDVVLLGSSGNQIEIRFGDGAGTFGAHVTLPVGPGGSSLLVARLDTDPISDLVVTNSSSNTISLVRGSSSSFAPAQNFFVGTYPNSAAAADFDHDGDLDLAIGISQYPNSVALLVNGGAANFGSPSLFASPIGSVIAGKFTDDDDPDLVVTSVEAMSLFTGNGAGGFSITTIGGQGFRLAAAGDFNRDGRLDLAGSLDNQIGVLLSSATGFALPPTTSLGGYAVSPLATGDFNGDGIADLVASRYYYYPYQILVLLSDGVGGLTTSAALTVGDNVRALAVADVNEDTKPDILAAVGNFIFVYPGSGGGSFGGSTSFNVGSLAGAFGIALMNGDSHFDVVVTRPGDNSIAVMIGTGTGSFGAPAVFSVGASPQDVKLADLDGDGKTDAVVSYNYAISALLGDGAGAFTSISSFATVDSGNSLALGDFNGDGWLDAAVTDYYSANVAHLLGNGLGGFGPVEYSPSFSGAVWLLAGDFNGDSRSDLVVSGGQNVGILSGDGSGAFDAPKLYRLGSSVGPSVAGPFNSDGRLDLAAATSGSVALLFNTNCQFRHLGILQDVSACDVAGQPLSGQPEVAAYDDGGNVVSCSSGQVTASIVAGTGTPGAVLGGTTTAPMVSGVASFSDLSVDAEGVGYQLRFTHTEGTQTYSRSFSTGLPPIAVVSTVCPYSSGHTAALPDAGPEAIYTWTVENGVITAGAGTRMITFKAGPSGEVILRVNVALPGLPCLLMREVHVAIDPALSCPAPVGFFTVTPCRVLDTRDPGGVWGGPSLTSGTTRIFPISGRCGIPTTATSVAINVTVVSPTQGGHLTLFPPGTPVPTSSTINFSAGAIRANNAILPLGAAGDLAVLCVLGGPGNTHFVLDVNGYFE